ncbi:hypothetical protein AAFF_G00432860 [Aldrovandia affinis]|uniref:Uncharacterized protein n=1 Tax=Aldrovandia affinis TaxID=143900 RepID=A0AAD7S8M2_9TELE|nr:hypothetical protein AAFF_G00432860 [Aldrovandia affinis]
MQALATLYNSMDHQIEALKFLKRVHLQQIANSNCSVELQGEDHGGREKEQRITASQNRSTSLNGVTDLCARSSLKSDSGSSSASKRTVRTIAERARESIFVRLTEIVLQVISVEQDLCRSAPRDQMLSLHNKDSIELRNICSRMSSADARCQSERDLKELGNCLRRIVDSLLCSLAHNNCLAVTPATRKLREICATFPDF